MFHDGRRVSIIGVSTNGKTVFQEGFGCRSKSQRTKFGSEAPDGETIYSIGSITQVLTASLICILVDEGKLEWHTPVSDIIGLKSRSAFHTSHMTAIDLLSHRTSLAGSDYWWTECKSELFIQRSETLFFFNALQPTGSLRSSFKYNNWNFAILGEIIEELTGESYDTVLADRIFKPLGMERTSAAYMCGDNMFDDNFADAYAVLDDRLPFLLAQPAVAGENEAHLVLQNYGSLPGYMDLFSIVPNMDTSIVVLVNSSGLGDPADWIYQLILETIIETKTPNDYVALAKEAALYHAGSIKRIVSNKEKARRNIPLRRPLSDFTGHYRDSNQDFAIVVRQPRQYRSKAQPQILFRGRESQVWDLVHYEADIFRLDATFNDLAKRSMSTLVDSACFTFRFDADTDGRIWRLHWEHEPAVSVED
ncbi:beta-lactamase/transpeptidase-like protein [Podospora didyma]|uniref:Beta-lactamase/transpeptidase-like protein n=1 Tax=Podospora didyma TaxID=330526 RepID=A0AAE0P3V6_9PEZI|nr:beta-lactamase/transpeptidase-like protein [Podospora didyma]